jgi:hypothetical protein
MNECHAIGQLTMTISEDIAQCTLKIKSTVIFVIMWAFQKYMRLYTIDHSAHREVPGHSVTNGHASGECAQLEGA